MAVETIEPTKTQQRFLLYSRKQELISPESPVLHFHRASAEIGIGNAYISR